MIQREGNHRGYVSHRMAHRARRLHFRATHIPAAKVSRSPVSPSFSLHPHLTAYLLYLPPPPPGFPRGKFSNVAAAANAVRGTSILDSAREGKRSAVPAFRLLSPLMNPLGSHPDGVRASNSRVMYRGPEQRPAR